MVDDDSILRCPNCGVKVDPREHLNPGPCCTLLCPLCNHYLTRNLPSKDE